VTENPQSGLLKVHTFIIPSSLIVETLCFLRETGQYGAEGFVLWGGVSHGEDEFRFTRSVVPKQRALTTPDGLLVVVDGSALFEVNKALYESGEILGAQIHSHPTSAYHSHTDDHYPMVTLLGALSVVVPDFARNAPDDIDTWAWYRLEKYSRWAPLTQDTKVIFE
jgi:hypothetical protein